MSRFRCIEGDKGSAYVSPILRAGQFVQPHSSGSHHVILWSIDSRGMALDLVTHKTHWVQASKCSPVHIDQVVGTFEGLSCTFVDGTERRRGVIKDECVEGSTKFVREVHVTLSDKTERRLPLDAVTITGKAERW